MAAWNVLGVEIRYKRVVLCARKIDKLGLSNALITRYHGAYLDDLLTRLVAPHQLRVLVAVMQQRPLSFPIGRDGAAEVRCERGDASAVYCPAHAREAACFAASTTVVRVHVDIPSLRHLSNLVETRLERRERGYRRGYRRRLRREGAGLQGCRGRGGAARVDGRVRGHVWSARGYRRREGGRAQKLDGIGTGLR